MASQVSPGVILRERDLTNTQIVGDSAITAAFASSFQKGPIGEIVTVSSLKDFVSVFGTPSDANAEDWLVASEFLGYGGNLAVVRAQTGVLNATSDGSAVLIRNDSDFESGVGGAEVFAARSAGTWGNSLKVVAVDRGADQILTLASAPATTAANTAFSTVSGKSGRIYSFDAASNELAVILDDPTTLLTSAEIFDEPGDGLATAVTAGAYNGLGSQNGSHTVDPTGGSGTGLRLEVIIDVNGLVSSVSITAGGTGYEAGDVVTCPAANLGTGATADLSVTVIQYLTITSRLLQLKIGIQILLLLVHLSNQQQLVHVLVLLDLLLREEFLLTNFMQQSLMLLEMYLVLLELFLRERLTYQNLAMLRVLKVHHSTTRIF